MELWRASPACGKVSAKVVRDIREEDAWKRKEKSIAKYCYVGSSLLADIAIA